MRKVIIISLLIIKSNLLAQQNWFTTYQDADLMLSGVRFNNSGGALLFNHPSGIASDGTKFLLCDRFNNRVLIWNNHPTQWNDEPNLVLGQTDMFGNNSGSSKSQLNFPGNVSVGSNGKVVIADTDNDRILIWNSFPTYNGQSADVSISLPAISQIGSDRYEWPWGVWTDGTKLIATATRGKAILFWNSIPTTDNQQPDYTIKLPQFGTLRNISTDGSTFLFVSDHNATVTTNGSATFFWNSFPTTSNQNYDWFFPEWIKGVKTQDGKLIAGSINSVYIWNVFPISSSQSPNIILRNNYYLNGDGPDVLVVGGRLYVNNYNGNNVQVYNSVPNSSTQLPDWGISTPSININTLQTINYIQNPVVATDGKNLFVTSDFDRSLWIWKTLNPTNGQAPDIKINLMSSDLAPWDNALFNNKFVAVGRKKVAIWDSLPLNGQAPSKIFSDRIGSIFFNELKGVAFDSSFFYLGDANGKIYLWNSLPSTGNEEPAATITLPKNPVNHLSSDGIYLCAAIQSGQPSIYIFKVSDLKIGNLNPYKEIQRGNPPNQLPLNLPASAITFNESFAIANTSGNSVLLWKNLSDAGDASKVIILGQPSLDSTRPGTGINKLHMPASLCAYKNNLWIGEIKFSSRILRFSYFDLTDVENKIENQIDDFVLYQSYPNPFNSTTTIKFTIPTPLFPSSRQVGTDFSKGGIKGGSFVTLKIYDILGREAATLVNEEKSTGEYEIQFTTDDSRLTSGIYFYQLHAGSYVETKKMIYLK